MGGSSSTQRTTIPDYVEDANKLAIQRANQIFELGRTPFTGIDVVGINPAERAAMENVASAASAFGMAVPQGGPFEGMETQTIGGLTGYSSYPLYIADMERLKEQRPDQYAAFARMSGFDPITGAALSPQAPASASIGGVARTPFLARSGGSDENYGVAMHRGTGSSYSSDGSTANYSSTGRAPTVRPKLRPEYRVSDSSGRTVGYTNSPSGTSSIGSSIQSNVKKLFSALTGGA